MTMNKHEDTPYFYTKAPDGVSFATDLSPTAKIAIIQIVKLATKKGHAWAAQDTMAKFVNVSTKTLRTAIKEAVDAGYLIVEEGNRTLHYRPNWKHPAFTKAFKAFETSVDSTVVGETTSVNFTQPVESTSVKSTVDLGKIDPSDGNILPLTSVKSTDYLDIKEENDSSSHLITREPAASPSATPPKTETTTKDQSQKETKAPYAERYDDFLDATEEELRAKYPYQPKVVKAPLGLGAKLPNPLGANTSVAPQARGTPAAPPPVPVPVLDAQSILKLVNERYQALFQHPNIYLPPEGAVSFIQGQLDREDIDGPDDVLYGLYAFVGDFAASKAKARENGERPYMTTGFMAKGAGFITKGIGERNKPKKQMTDAERMYENKRLWLESRFRWFGEAWEDFAFACLGLCFKQERERQERQTGKAVEIDMNGDIFVELVKMCDGNYSGAGQVLCNVERDVMKQFPNCEQEAYDRARYDRVR